jgi:hypothetical protein
MQTYIIKLMVLVLSGLAGGLLSGWFIHGEAKAKDQIDTYYDSVTARIFRLVDESGNLRGVFGFGEDKSPSIILYDKNKSARVYLTSFTSGPMMVFRDTQDRMRAAIRLDNAGEFTLTYFDEANKHRASLLVNPDDGPKFSLMDKNGTIRLAVALHKGQQPALLLMNESGKQESVIFNHGKFGPGLFIHDASGMPQMAYTGRGPVDASKAGQGKN